MTYILTSTGTNLVLTTATNKGGVAIPVQVHGKDMVFLSAHLPSDTGKSTNHFHARNAAASSIIRETVPAEEDLGEY